MTGVATGKGDTVAKVARIGLRLHKIHAHIPISMCSGLLGAFAVKLDQGCLQV